MKTGTILRVVFATAAYAQQSVWGQCGGINWPGPTTCVAGSYCFHQNPYYYQCLPGAAATTAANPPPPPPISRSSVKISSMTISFMTNISTKAPPPTSSTKISSTTASSTPTATAGGKTQFAGVNIAGFDFGCQTDGSCNLADTYGPVASLGNLDGAGQMQHFVKDDHMNIFRLHVAWQFLQPAVGGSFNQTAVGRYDLLVQQCLATGAHCIIDIHNYARFNGAIIEQGGPTNAQFASFWDQLAAKYACSSKVVFGIMNEPYDLLSIISWAASVQAAVTAIRSAGATSQIILLPGTDYTSAAQFISNGSSAALSTVMNLDGSTTNLIFDVHEYHDSDNSGTHSECVTSNVDVFTILAKYLRSNKRQALLSETGGGNVQSCESCLCQEVAYLNANSDVYLGYIGWGAGSFSPTTYILTETPINNGGSWTDQPLVKACLAR